MASDDRRWDRKLPDHVVDTDAAGGDVLRLPEPGIHNGMVEIPEER